MREKVGIYNIEHTALNWIKKSIMRCHIEHFNHYITLSFNGHIDRKRKDNWKLLSDFLFSAPLESFPLTRHVSVIMTLDKCIIIRRRSILGSNLRDHLKTSWNEDWLKTFEDPKSDQRILSMYAENEWRLWGLDIFRLDEWTKISISRAPDGAKNV